MRPTLLTDAQRRTFEENGYLIVPNALDTSEIDQLLETGDRLMDDFDLL